MTIDMRSRWSNLPRLACVTLAVFAAGCGYFQIGGSDAAAQKARDEKTREEVAKATENAKPKLEEAGQKDWRGGKDRRERCASRSARRKGRLGSRRARYRGLEFRQRKRSGCASGDIARRCAQDYRQPSVQR